MSIDTMKFGLDPIRKDDLKVGDIAYIIESKRSVREVTIVKRSRRFCTVRFADTHGAISISSSRLYGTREQAEETLPKKKTVNAGPRPPHRIW